jgi:hypothetical protein
VSNVDRLAQVGLIKKNELTEEHKKIIDDELTTEEIDALIRVRNKFNQECSMHYGTHMADVF